MTGASTQGRARSFDAWAADYDRYRPPYPDALFDEIASRLRLSDRPLVVDLGAGTGRAALAMAERGWRVTAVEPGRPMIDVMRSRAANDGLVLAMVQASAEATGLDPASADLATAAQAYHWFEATAALTEMARIVRGGGGIALFWNVRDAERSPLVADYHALLSRFGIRSGEHSAGPMRKTAAEIAAVGAFEPAQSFQVRHESPMRPQEFVGLAFTASYVRQLAPEKQAAFHDELLPLVERHAAGSSALTVPYTVDCWIARRRGP
jgi:SAM-dependent methyltransferase